MRQGAAFLLAMLSLVVPPAFGDSPQSKAIYVGGTAELKGQRRAARWPRPKAESPQEHGVLNPDAEGACLFTYKGGTLAIAHNTIKRLSYGEQHLPGVGHLTQHRYLTVEFSDPQGRDQSAVFDLILSDKSRVRSVIETLEARTGKQAVCEDAFASETLHR